MLKKQALSLGLSPLTRGNHQAHRPAKSWQGSIPAHTGEPKTEKTTVKINRVYPRSHGGTAISAFAFRSVWGLSPLTRGTPGNRPLTLIWCGSIPARTGEPHHYCYNVVTDGVYPRSHGGTTIGVGLVVVTGGLSPLARGNLTKAEQHYLSRGSIPARTGEPCTSRLLDCLMRVYPRSHGGTEP